MEKVPTLISVTLLIRQTNDSVSDYCSALHSLQQLGNTCTTKHHRIQSTFSFHVPVRGRIPKEIASARTRAQITNRVLDMKAICMAKFSLSIFVLNHPTHQRPKQNIVFSFVSLKCGMQKQIWLIHPWTIIVKIHNQKMSHS